MESSFNCKKTVDKIIESLEKMQRILNKYNFNNDRELINFLDKYKNHECISEKYCKLNINNFVHANIEGTNILTEVENKNIQTDIKMYPKIKINKSRKYIPKRLNKNETKVINVNTWYKWIDFSKYTIGTTIIAQKKGWDNKIIIIGNFCDNCREPTNQAEKYCTTCYNDISGKSGTPGIRTYNGKHNKCKNCCNLFLYNNKDDEYCHNCILDYCENCHILEEELKKYKIKNKDRKNIKLKNSINKLKNGDFYGKKEFKIYDKIFIFNGKYNSKEEKYTFLNYFNNNFWNEKYNYLPFSDNDIEKMELSIKKEEDIKNKYWNKYYEEKKQYKNNLNETFKDYPTINIDKQYFENKYNNKKVSGIYKNIIKELDYLEEEYNNFRKIEEIYNKIKSKNVNILKEIKSIEDNVFNNLITEYENIKINEYTLLSNIGKRLNEGLNEKDIKKINIIKENSRSSRLIRYCKRIYMLEKYFDIKSIFNSGVTNFLRDATDNNFNLFMNFCIKFA